MSLSHSRCLTAILLFCAGVLSAQKPLVLSDMHEQYALLPYLEILQDASGTLAFEDILSDSADAVFTTLKQGQSNLGFTEAAIWLRCRLTDVSEQPHSIWYLQHNYANTHYMDVYIQTCDTGSYQIYRSGMLRPFSQRPMRYHKLLFPVRLEKQTPRWVYIRIQSSASINLFLNIFSRASFTGSSNLVFLETGFYIGFALFLMLFSLIIFLYQGDRAFLTYALHVLCILLFFTTLDGLTVQYLFPEHPEWMLIFMPFLNYSIIVTFLVFANAFLITKRKAAVLYKLNTGLVMLTALLFLGSFFMNNTTTGRIMVSLTAIIVLLLLFEGFLMLRRGFKPALFFIISWLIYLSSIIYLSLARLGLAQVDSAFPAVSKAGFILASFLMAAALADRYKRLRREQQAAAEQLAQVENALHKTKALLMASIEASPAGILIADAPDVRIRFANSAALGIRGKSSQPLTDIPSDLHPKHWQTYQPDGKPFKPADLPLSRAVLKGEVVENVEVVILRADGEKRWVLANAAPVRDKNGIVIAGVVIFPDITELKHAEGALRESEERFRMLFDYAPDAYYLTDLYGQFIDGNRSAEQMIGGEKKDYIGKNLFQLNLLSIRDIPIAKRILENSRKGIATGPVEIGFTRPDGKKIDIEIITLPVTIRTEVLVLGLARDITERKRDKQIIEDSLQEKIILLKEVHHRVKNNLQIISSLLNLQARQIDDKRAAAYFQESMERIRSMALIHEKLYQSEQFSQIAFDQYLRDLAGSLRRNYILDQTINITFDLASISFPLDKAVPTGLIVNELLTNAMKHAFPVGFQGERKIAVTLKQDGRHHISISVADTGQGLPDDFDPEASESLGMKLIRILVKEQLDGELHVNSADGTRITILLPNLVK